MKIVKVTQEDLCQNQTKQNRKKNQLKILENNLLNYQIFKCIYLGTDKLLFLKIIICTRENKTNLKTYFRKSLITNHAHSYDRILCNY